jgi:DNA-binding NtrC family response regulator
MKTILWIDDDRKLLDASVDVFREYGFELIKATNTSRALTILRAQKLDGVLLDVRLRGGEDGLELLQELRRIYPSLQVVIFTGYPGYDHHVIARRLGASFYFEKVRKQIPIERAERRKFFAALHQIFETTPTPTERYIKACHR